MPIFAVKTCTQKSHDKSWRRGYFLCPGCNDMHVINLDTSRPLNQPYWSFNESVEAPTITQPIRSQSQSREPRSFRNTTKVCNAVITDGKITFAEDSTHELSGQTVPLPELPAWFMGIGLTNQTQGSQGAP